MEKQTFRVGKLSKAIERAGVPVSPVVRAGDFVFVSGVAPVNPETGKVEITDIATQTVYVLENVKACLEAAGSSLDKVVKANVLIANSAYYQTVNEIYARYFRHDPSARTVISVGSWHSTFDIEIDCIAIG
jgi:2-iminobutanoate/2-iminopropanoate deaminase